jgi:hypothetical protein
MTTVSDFLAPDRGRYLDPPDLAPANLRLRSIRVKGKSHRCLLSALVEDSSTKTALNHCGVFHYQFNCRTASRYNHRDLVLTLGTRLGPHEMSALATALGQLRFPGPKENSVPSRASQE